MDWNAFCIDYALSLDSDRFGGIVVVLALRVCKMIDFCGIIVCCVILSRRWV